MGLCFFCAQLDATNCVCTLVMFNYVLECFWFVLFYLVKRKLMCSCVSVIMIAGKAGVNTYVSFVLCVQYVFEERHFCACVTQGPRLERSPLLVSYTLHSYCTQVTCLRHRSFLCLTLKISFGGGVCLQGRKSNNKLKSNRYCL